MRAFSYILIVLGIFLLASAGYDQCRGRTTAPGRLGKHFNTAYLYRRQVVRKENPELFAQFMRTHWTYAFLTELGGWLLFVTARKLDDPPA